MLLQNSMFSTIDLHTKNINNYLINNNCFDSNYKIYDKNIDDNITFVVFEIELFIKNKGGIILDYYKYEGELKYTYNKRTCEIVITSIPKILYNNFEVKVFTSDIAKIIIKSLNKEISNDRLKITFDKVYPFAIDDRVIDIIPNLSNTYNYNFTKRILEIIKQEIEQVKLNVKRERAIALKKEKSLEKAMSKKRRIFGLDLFDFENYEEFIKQLNKKIIDNCNYKINNIKRHIDANKEKYLKLMVENSELIDFDYLEEDYIKKEDLELYNLLLEIEETSDKGMEYEILHNNELLYKYAKLILKNDLYDDDGTYIYLEQARKERFLNKYKWEEGIKINFDATAVYDELSDMMEGGHSFFFSHLNIKFINLLLQIKRLETQLTYYENLKQNPNNLLQNYIKNNDSFGSISQYPYWIRLGRDTHSMYNNNEYERIYLFMIKPTVNYVDFSDIRFFKYKNGRDLGSNNVKRLQFITDVINKRNYKTERLIIGIPDSISEKSLYDIINFSFENSIHLLFVCESQDLYSRVRRILTNKSIYDLKNNNYFKGHILICVDPKYYDTFIAESPSNKVLWHKYDYSSDYKYRRKKPYDFNSEIYASIIYNYQKNGYINWKEINESILGGYSGDLLDNNIENIINYRYNGKLLEQFGEIIHADEDLYEFNQEIEEYYAENPMYCKNNCWEDWLGMDNECRKILKYINE